MARKKALIFGMSGQAGYYLAELLWSKDYEIHGTFSTIAHTHDEKSHKWYRLDLANQFDKSTEVLIEKVRPDEIYNLASSMYAPASWDNPVEYMQVNAMVVARMLETYRKVNPDGRFFQAGSADVLDLTYQPQNERTEKKPRTPYGVAKLAAQEMVRVYREKYGVYACTGILFNMESPRRPKTFFTTKVAQQVAQVARGERESVKMGRLTAIRDWGRTEEYVEAMWKMLQDPGMPRDYVIGTGQSASCLEFVLEAMSVAGIPKNRLGYEFHTDVLEQDSLRADPSEIRYRLQWRARSSWVDVVRELVEAELGKSTVTG